ncbi:RidA family protein [Sphingobacterium haloxyli]|uniref:RidA family protein n=1 Tax=Sphingobacterium haloxyli TaxID=2100533 RepID=A0A2S9J6R3_9SPHI|nr:RidA family protein [Sphingobacterium haloxyli]PRD48475.1 RidA family protein [Sphingobacterium haloxyli]
MQKRIINPWTWSEDRGYAQSVEVKQVESTLYCAGQAAVLADGTSSDADMKTQMNIALQNLEKVISEAGYACKNIVRLNIYSTSTDELLSTCFDVYVNWARKNNVETALTVMEVNALYETLNIEFEATLVK